MFVIRSFPPLAVWSFTSSKCTRSPFRSSFLSKTLPLPSPLPPPPFLSLPGTIFFLFCFCSLEPHMPVAQFFVSVAVPRSFPSLGDRISFLTKININARFQFYIQGWRFVILCSSETFSLLDFKPSTSVYLLYLILELFYSPIAQLCSIELGEV